MPNLDRTKTCPQTPVRDHGWCSNNIGVLPRNICWTGAGHEVQVHYASNDEILQRVAVGVLAESNVHSIGVCEKYAMRPRFPMFKIDGVTPVQI